MDLEWVCHGLQRFLKCDKRGEDMSAISAKQIIDVIKKAKVVRDADSLEIDRALREQGIDSLDISGILFNLEEAFGVRIPDEDVDALQTISDMVEYINARK